MDAAVGRSPVALLLWESFRQRVCTAIEECNYAAGEAIWAVTGQPGVSRLRIGSNLNSSCRLELSLDSDRRAVCCEFGSATRTHRWAFHLMPGGTTLRRGTTTYRVNEAVDATLDHLIGCADQPHQVGPVQRRQTHSCS